MIQSKIKILIIEDNWLDSEYLEELFVSEVKKQGYSPQINKALNEKDAFIYLNNHSFDIVVFDIDLDSRGAGLKLLKRFSDKILFPLISTSRKSEEIIEKGYDYGSEHFINK